MLQPQLLILFNAQLTVDAWSSTRVLQLKQIDGVHLWLRSNTCECAAFPPQKPGDQCNWWTKPCGDSSRGRSYNPLDTVALIYLNSVDMQGSSRG